jgi:hypothetical protein
VTTTAAKAKRTQKPEKKKKSMKAIKKKTSREAATCKKVLTVKLFLGESTNDNHNKRKKGKRITLRCVHSARGVDRKGGKVMNYSAQLNV